MGNEKNSLTLKEARSIKIMLLMAYQDSIVILRSDCDMLNVLIISDYFHKMHLCRRFEDLSDLFERENPDICRKYTLIFEPVTEEEWEKRNE